MGKSELEIRMIFALRQVCRDICVTIQLPVGQCGETMHWQPNANTPLSVSLF